MELVLGILILLALCGSRAAKNGLTLLIGVPLGVLAAIMLIGMLIAVGHGVVTAVRPAPNPATLQMRREADLDDASHAAGTLIDLRKRHGSQALPPWNP